MWRWITRAVCNQSYEFTLLCGDENDSLFPKTKDRCLVRMGLRPSVVDTPLHYQVSIFDGDHLELFVVDL